MSAALSTRPIATVAPPSAAAPAAALHLPRTLFAPGAIAALEAELLATGLRRPLLVTDRGVLAAGLADRVLASCGAVQPVLFSGVTENPLFADVDSGTAMLREQGCDGVLAVGGGSVIDSAKIIALLGRNEGSARDFVGVPHAAHRAGVPLVAIPTTAGTGSEASPSAGIHPDASTPSLGMNSRHLVPALAILDPELTLSLPPQLSAATGIDALSHCIEGYLSKNSQALGKAIALDGIARVARHLRRAVRHGNDVEARAQMMLAAFAGGTSIAMGLGPAHAVALCCSDQGYPHGVLSGIGLVATLDGTARHAPAAVAAVAQAFGCGSATSLPLAIGSLMRELGLPTSLAELGYSAPDLDRLAAAAHSSHFNRFAPFHPSALDYAAWLSASLHATRSP